MAECKHNWQTEGMYAVCKIPGCGEKWNTERLLNCLQGKCETAEQALAEAQGEIGRLDSDLDIHKSRKEKAYRELEAAESREKALNERIGVLEGCLGLIRYAMESHPTGLILTGDIRDEWTKYIDAALQDAPQAQDKTRGKG